MNTSMDMVNELMIFLESSRGVFCCELGYLWCVSVWGGRGGLGILDG